MSVVTYKCPNCDGGLVFDPSSQKFVCEYCQSKFTQAELTKQEPAATEQQAQAGQPQSGGADGDMLLYSCPSCGAEVVTDTTTAATFCYYCHNPVVLAGRLDGAYLPDKVVPFTIDREQAKKQFLAWAKKKWFIPKYFFSKEQIEKITGVYFPHWVVDSDAVGKMDTHGQKVRTWRTGDVEYTQTKNYRVIREGTVHYEDITRSALKKANKQLVDGIHPFDDQQMVDFSMGYLSGFQAEKRDVEKAELEQEVNQEIGEYTKDYVSQSAGEYVGISSSDAVSQIVKTDWSYAMLPVWTLTYKGRDGKLYYYAMNGQSGKVCGKLPLDFKKLALLFAAIAAPLFAMLTLGGYLL